MIDSMVFNPDIHHRRSLRLKGYDYSCAGAYFVTICTWQRECLFGAIEDGEMRLNEMGLIVESLWCRLQEHFTNINLEIYAIMPNHFHGILHITESVGAKQATSDLPGFCGDCGEDKGKVKSKGKAGETFALPLRGTQGTVPGSFCAVIQKLKSVSTRKINKVRNSPGCRTGY